MGTLVSSVASAQETVSVRSLLPQMWDLRYLTHPPKPAFTMAQASSYDRGSDPGRHQDWFANGDAGQFIRTETVDGRTERVMADLKGPGAVVRVWSANPQGTIRFYFDGEKTPRLVAPMSDLLTGKVKPFVDPFSYMASQGTNLYFPMPYAKSLKVTAENTNNLYYHVGYRSYAAGTKVETFDLAGLSKVSKEIQVASDHLTKLQVGQPSKRVLTHHVMVGSGQRELLWEQSKPGTVTELKLRIPFAQSFREMDWTDAQQPHNVLRNVQIEIDFDGERCVQCPVGDFFSTSPGVNVLHSLPFEVRADGAMTCRLPMAFTKRMKIWLNNLGPASISADSELAVDGRKPAADSYHLYAQWTAEHQRTRPMHDMTFLKVKGEGYWIGSNLHIGNPVPAWWGEGDEKVYVDGESFPSTFGTGTEDYYGYAWSSPNLFERPYHAQSRCDGPGTRGNINVHRWQLFDPIPYTQSLKFDLEMWHWADVQAYVARTAYWYAKPGGTSPAVVDKSLLAPPEYEKMKPVKGAIEGESLAIAEQHGGKIEMQEGFWELSSGKQLWWTDVQPMDRLVLKVPVMEAGTYEVVGNFCHAKDYGIHEMKLNGKEIAPMDFYGTGVEWKLISLGTFTLEKGDAVLEIECVGNNASAVPGRMFGLDYLLLKRQ